jgi:hypothetical protein
MVQMDLHDMTIADDEDDSSDEDESEDELDPIAAERRRRNKAQDRLRRSAGEPLKPDIHEVIKLQDGFGAMLRAVLAE